MFVEGGFRDFPDLFFVFLFFIFSTGPGKKNIFCREENVFFLGGTFFLSWKNHVCFFLSRSEGFPDQTYLQEHIVNYH